jgi:uncharacterized protein
MDWNELLRALALVLVIEGLMPFAFPAQWRIALQRLALLDTRWLRLAGLGSMFAGVLLLQFL